MIRSESRPCGKNFYYFIDQREKYEKYISKDRTAISCRWMIDQPGITRVD